MSLKVLTANRLREGDVVYLSRAGRWTTELAAAATIEEAAEEAQLLALAEAAVAERLVVGPYVMTVALEAGRLRPLSQRERIRAAGPSVAFGPAAQAPETPSRDTQTRGA